MTDETFWKVIDASRARRNAAASDHGAALQEELEKLPAADIVDFDRKFRTLHAAAYTWDLWAAAYIIGGGCSDDSFIDFRSGLIGLGRQAYTDAVRDPATLVSQPTRGVDFFVEELAYAASNAYATVTGSELPENDVKHSDEPTGERWDEATVARKYPALAEKFGL